MTAIDPALIEKAARAIAATDGRGDADTDWQDNLFARRALSAVYEAMLVRAREEVEGPIRALLDAEATYSIPVGETDSIPVVLVTELRAALTLGAIAHQRDLGWPDIHPEDFCHRCGGKNISWWVDSSAWDIIMRQDGPGSSWLWNEIICPQCFAELFEARFPNTSWRLSVDPDTIGGRVFAALSPPAAAAHDAGDEEVPRESRQEVFESLAREIHYARCQYVKGVCSHRHTFTPKDNDVASILMAPGGWLAAHDAGVAATERDLVVRELQAVASTYRPLIREALLAEADRIARADRIENGSEG